MTCTMVSLLCDVILIGTDPSHPLAHSKYKILTQKCFQSVPVIYILQDWHTFPKICLQPGLTPVKSQMIMPHREDKKQSALKMHLNGRRRIHITKCLLATWYVRNIYENQPWVWTLLSFHLNIAPQFLLPQLQFIFLESRVTACLLIVSFRM